MFQCPHCKTLLAPGPLKEGEAARCPACSGLFRVPALVQPPLAILLSPTSASEPPPATKPVVSAKEGIVGFTAAKLLAPEVPQMPADAITATQPPPPILEEEYEDLPDELIEQAPKTGQSKTTEMDGWSDANVRRPSRRKKKRKLRPQPNSFSFVDSIPLDYWMQTNLGIGMGILIWIGITVFVIAQGLNPLTLFAGRMMMMLFAIPFWVWGLAAYAKSKGLSEFWGLLGIATIIGAIVLYLLPDNTRRRS